MNKKCKCKVSTEGLSIGEKIELFNALYTDLSGKGTNGDTELAHVNAEEMVVLREMGGSGDTNPNTGLIQFGGGGSPPPPPPTQSTVTQQATIPDELKPFITDILEKAKGVHDKREEEGYVPFEGPQIAEFTPEQERAFTGLEGLVGAGQPYFDQAQSLTQSSTQAPDQAGIDQFMSPYIQNVVDIQQREAARLGDVERQRIGAAATQAGGFGGSRHAIIEAEQNRNLQQQLGDIQGKGLAAAYEDAQSRLQQQRERERLGGAQMANLGVAAPAQALKEFTGLEAIGAQRQGQSQQALDIAQQEYEISRTFPERSLQDYSSLIRGYAAPIPATTLNRSSTTKPAPSFLQQGLGLGAAAAGIAGQFGAFSGKKKGGLVGLLEGGKVVSRHAEGFRVGTTDKFTRPPSPFSKIYEQLMGDRGNAAEELRKRAEIKKNIEAKEERRILDEAYAKPEMAQYKPFIEDFKKSNIPEVDENKIPVKQVNPASRQTGPVDLGDPDDGGVAADAEMAGRFAPDVPEITGNVPQAEQGVEGPVIGEQSYYDQKSLDLQENYKTLMANKRQNMKDQDFDKEKWGILAQFGANLLSQPGGQTFLESVGKASQDPLDKLANLNTKQKAMLSEIDNLNIEEVKTLYGFNEADARRYAKHRELDNTLSYYEAKAKTARGAELERIMKRKAELLKPIVKDMFSDEGRKKAMKTIESYLDDYGKKFGLENNNDNQYQILQIQAAHMGQGYSPRVALIMATEKQAAAVKG